MTGVLQTWTRRHGRSWLAGALLWAAIAGVSFYAAQRTGEPYLETMVTWDEWAVSVMVLPWLGHFMSQGFNAMTRGSRVSAAMQNVMYGGSTDAVAMQLDEELANAAKRPSGRLRAILGGMAVVVFALDLLVRGLFGLGWQPFL